MMSTEKLFKRVLATAIVAAACLVPAMGFAQFFFNIDLDCEFCPPEGGGGKPPDSFAAAGAAGVWNKIRAAAMDPTRLVDLTGDLTDVIMSGPGGGSEGGNNYQGQLANRLLMNDGRLIASSDTWLFEEVPNGTYDVISYAVFPWHENSYNPTPVTVSGAGTKYVTGPWQ